MPFVLDASVVLAWALSEPHPTAEAARIRLETDTAVTPGLWWFEIRNALVVAERRGRIGEHDSDRFLAAALAPASITADSTPSGRQVMTLARQRRLTVYDAAYLELALRQGLPLATLDVALAAAAQAEGVALVG